MCALFSESSEGWLYGFFWSLDEVVGDLRNHVRPYVRPYVRTSVTLLLENRSLLFSETLQLVRACKCEKNVPSAFLKKIPVSPILAKNCPKWGILAQNAQKWRFLRIFLGIPSLLFSETLHLIRAFNSEKNVPNAFLKKIPVLPILAKNCPKLAILAQNAQKWRFFAFFAIRSLEFANFLY